MNPSFHRCLKRFVMAGMTALGAVGVARVAADSAGAPGAPRVRIMIVGVAHLVSKKNLHNTDLGDPLGPKRQGEISELARRLLAFGPTKVMIEAPYGDSRFADRYKQYLAGTYVLGPNEIYQYGFRLAALAKDGSIYPIDDSDNFPFDYDAVKTSAKLHGQTSLLDEAEAAGKPLIDREDELAKNATIVELLRYLNTPQALDENASWYLYVDRVGGAKDYAGADLVSYWYARNLHIFANIMRWIDAPQDRVIVFIGQGHAKLLRQFVEQSPDLELVDPEPYLK